MYDEPVTLHLAKSVATGQLPFVDFYEHHSPLPWYVLALLSPYSLWRGQRLLIAIGGVLALCGLVSLSWKLWGIRAGILAGILGTVSPLWQHQGNMIIHDSFLVIAEVLALLAWWYALQHEINPFGWLLAGLGGGLVVLCKQTGVLTVLALWMGILLFTRSFKAAILYILGISIPFIPFLFIYRGEYGALFNGLLGWNLAANIYLEPNPKWLPFINDIFTADPLLWSCGLGVAILSLRYFQRRNEFGKDKSLLFVCGLIVLMVLMFNWFLAKQTFGQYYLQAIPALIVLSSFGLDWVFHQRFPIWSKALIGLFLVYLGLINPLMNSMIPWTPDLKEKGAITEWVSKEIKDEEIWEPWVYYSYLAGKEFSFYYPFLSIHSVRNEPGLPTIDGKGNIQLESYLTSRNIHWIILHQPLLPQLGSTLDYLLTTSKQDWQIVRTFEVVRYASESGMQSHFWTPWWKPLTFSEYITIWYRNPGTRQGGLVGELKVQNPTDEPFFFLEVQHLGGIDVYLMDKNSSRNNQYTFNWNQTGHAFFISGQPLLLDHRSTPDESNSLLISAIFSQSIQDFSQIAYRVRLQAEQESGSCSSNVDLWQGQTWVSQTKLCQTGDTCASISLTAQCYASVEGRNIGTPSP
jgi:hypothetical protein